MVNPVQPAANWFLALLDIIPTPIKLLMYVACGFFVILAIVNIVRK